MMCGILPVDKPAGWTSFDVLAKLRGVLGTKKLGHSGTLDPMATGVLAVFVGRATAAADRQPNHDKTYEATLRFGLRTDTGDVTGTPLETAQTAVTPEQLQAVLPRFVGQQSQLPPMYSAVKIDGQPLYKAARAGKTVERTARQITVYALEYLGRPQQGKDQDFVIRVACSKGTYIRTLAEDIGAAMGVPATLAALRRTVAGDFTIAQAHTLEELIALPREAVEQLLLPVDSVFGSLPALTVNEGVRLHLYNGCPTSHYPAEDGSYRVYAEDGLFLGLAKIEGSVLNVEKLFCERN